MPLDVESTAGSHRTGQRPLCLAGYRVLFRTAATLATELELAHKRMACLSRRVVIPFSGNSGCAASTARVNERRL